MSAAPLYEAANLTETVAIDCPADIWTLIAEDHQNVFIQNQQGKALKIHISSLAEPALDTEAFIVSQDYNPLEKVFRFHEQTQAKIWVMPAKREAVTTIVVRQLSPVMGEPLRMVTYDVPAYTVRPIDRAQMLNFPQGCIITVPEDLPLDFYCTLRQGGDDQITITQGAGATVEEIDGKFRSEKRLAILTLLRFPNGSFQLVGRTAV
ncbi:hypothetical protein [Rhizobium sp. WYJ-E13]|uniref:hypothetical protein n=1 Tax=Rhizobium sp. WYJ-E13 TaxID=2849093 RepID=UPI001C1EF14E|nr:hypothetical protein [Rhizobium sp. WYJ-E13]QWW69347.1 hypothetical protein KQ933_06490 [Rhizobium sp. WYJ-E13]